MTSYQWGKKWHVIENNMKLLKINCLAKLDKTLKRWETILNQLKILARCMDGKHLLIIQNYRRNIATYVIQSNKFPVSLWNHIVFQRETFKTKSTLHNDIKRNESFWYKLPLVIRLHGIQLPCFQNMIKQTKCHKTSQIEKWGYGIDFC